MAGSAASPQSTASATDLEVLVKRPSSNSSREIRDTILREYFGYTDADIAEMNRTKPDKFFYIRHKNETEWADADKVKKWSVDASGNLSIKIPDRVVQDLIAFREQRASFEIFKVCTFISDTAVREEVTRDLERILSSAGESRINAFNTLMTTIAASGKSRPDIYRALRFLTNESGYKNNPFLLIAFARTTVYRSSTPAWGSSQGDRALIAAALGAANESLYYISPKSALAKISRQEAAAINFWAGDLYNDAGAEDEGRRRKWIQRFMTMSGAERDTYREGDVIEMIPAGVTVIGSLSPADERLRQLESERAEKLAFEKEIEKIGNPNPPNDPRYNELFQKPGNTVEMPDALIRQKNRQGGKSYVPKYRTVDVSVPVFNRANVRMGGVDGPLNIIAEILKYIAANRKTNDLAEYLQKKSVILQQIERENRRVVPPRPEKVLRAIEEVKRYGRTSANSIVKRKVPAWLTELEVILEESNAFHNVEKP